LDGQRQRGPVKGKGQVLACCCLGRSEVTEGQSIPPPPPNAIRPSPLQATGLEPTKGLETQTPDTRQPQFSDALSGPRQSTVHWRPARDPRNSHQRALICRGCPLAHGHTSLLTWRPRSTRCDRCLDPRNIANSYKEAVHCCSSLLFRSFIFFCVEDQPCSFRFLFLPRG
jgi:hypothetical protein